MLLIQEIRGTQAKQEMKETNCVFKWYYTYNRPIYITHIELTWDKRINYIKLDYRKVTWTLDHLQISRMRNINCKDSGPAGVHKILLSRLWRCSSLISCRLIYLTYHLNNICSPYCPIKMQSSDISSVHVIKK